VNTQQISSIVRQVLALAAVIIGALSTSLAGIKLPTAVSTALVVGGSVIAAIEHFVSDPSTGSTDAPKVVVAPVATTGMAAVNVVPDAVAPAPTVPPTA
jgi:hypothetical protein